MQGILLDLARVLRMAEELSLLAALPLYLIGYGIAAGVIFWAVHNAAGAFRAWRESTNVNGKVGRDLEQRLLRLENFFEKFAEEEKRRLLSDIEKEGRRQGRFAALFIFVVAVAIVVLLALVMR